MTAAEFKVANPAAYAEIVADAESRGATAEQTRVATWMVWNDTDPVAVAAGIASSETLGPVAQAEFGKKMFAKQGLANIAADAPGAVTTSIVEGDKTPEAAQVAAFNAEVKKNLSNISII
jgi:hypothetical protein